MAHHIICLAGPDDRYTPALGEGDESLIVPFDVPGHPDSLQTTVVNVLARYKLQPGTKAWDLLHADIGAYVGDVRIPREAAYDERTWAAPLK